MILGARFLVLIVLLEMMVACGSQQPTAGSQNPLIVGTVTAGPVTPLARPGKPNSRPLPGATIEALRGNDVVAATRSDDHGRYELSVRPGTYLLRAKPPGRFLSKNPVKQVTIPEGETLTVNFPFDTGIR